MSAVSILSRMGEQKKNGEEPAKIASQVERRTAAEARKPNAQELLDMLVAAVLEERAGVIEQDGKVFLTVMEASEHSLMLRTLGQLWFGGETAIRCSTVGR